MRPILYNANETAFETYGLGEIDATKAQVTRERNGNYTLYIEYPASGPLAGTFKNDMRIKSDAGLRTKNQTFFISRILKDSTGILKVYAKHISHLTEKMAIRNNTNVSGTAQSALSIWASNCLGGIRFDVWSDIELMSKASWNIADFKTARDALGGVAGSILDVWGGEYEFDNTVIRLHKQLGRKSPIVLEYGRNILRAEDDQDIDGAYTSVYPYATYTPESQGTGEGGATSQQVTVELPEKYVDGPYIGLYNERRVLIVDFSSNFKDKEVPTIDKLRRLAKEYAINNRLGLPKINTKIEYVDLSKTLDYKLTQILEEAELCDIVPVYYPQIGLTSEDAKLTTIVYDVLLEQNDSVEVGVIGDGFKSSMTSNLSGKIDDLASNQQRLVNTLPDYLLNAQGNKVWYNRPDNSEHKVGDIWFEKNGLYDRMYVWNGSQWEKRIDTEDVDKIKKEVDKQISDAQISTNQAIAQANAKAEEALKKAGTLPDTSKLSDQIKTLILNSPDLSRKVTETFNNADNGDTIYSKIVSKVATNFATTAEVGGVYDRVNNLSDKIAKQTVEFNKLTESNKLYERILGTSETGAPDQLSRLVMSSQIFQTEVGKYSTSGGPNMLRNSRADDGLKYWTEANGRLNFTAHQFYFNGQKRMFELRPDAVVKSPRFIVKRGANYMLNMLGFDTNSKSFKVYFCKRKKGSTADFEGKQLIFEKNESPIFDNSMAVKKSFKFNVGDFDDGYLQFEYVGNDNGRWAGLFMTELDFYEGTADRKWQPSPDDSLGPLEAVKTQVTQLEETYSIKNINSAGDILGQLNLNKDGSIKLNEALIAIGEKTYVKDGVIKKAMIGNGQIGTAHIGEIDANIARLINVSAKNIVSDGLTANIIRGGVLASKNGKLNFDLDNSALESTSDESVIKRIGSGTNFPTQFFKFSKGWVQGRSQPVGLTILGSNRYGDGRSEDGNSGGFAGIRIWNGSNAEGYADSVDVVGDEIVLCDSPFQNRNGWLMKTTYSDTSLFSITNKRNSRIYAGDFLFEKAGGGNASLRQILWQIGDNIAQLYRFRAQNNEGTPGWNDTNKWGWS
ncbi:phage tail spike protein [Streptococcus parasanguinis]|uniref:phage tail spike protein n=1 Tax=Streptococcus parasanguinis TaxID=1318 RepID=UPI0020C8FDA7|nr:phage tail spike protein [Streptococcus parasanguinis]MCP9067522.1 gp58-like family protein [Streptococcus parasanguinis]